MDFVDKVTAEGWNKTHDGYLTANVKAARTGVQTYLGSEVGKPNLRTVNVYRPAEEVFKKDSMTSFVGKPVTDDHPKERVTADNWKTHSRGTIGEEVARDGEAIRLSIALMDASIIKKVEEGKRELSVGYVADLEWTSGKTEDGVAYDAIQRNIYVDHLAVVGVGRAGKEFRIGDSAEAWGVAPITDTERKETTVSDIKTTTVVVGDKAVVTTDEGATAIRDLKSQLQDAETSHKAAIATKDEEIGGLKAEVQKLKDAAPTPAIIDQMVADRVAIVEKVKAVDAAIVTDGKTNDELKKSAVAKRYGDDFVKDASPAEINGMFRTLTVTKDNADPLGKSRVIANDSSAADAGAKAYNDAVSEMTNAWRAK